MRDLAEARYIETNQSINPCLGNEDTGLEIPPISRTVEPVIFVPPPRYLDSVVFRISAVSLTSHVFEDSFQVCFGIFKCLGEKMT